MTVTELALQRKMTVSFIAGNPVSIALQPRTRRNTDTGGWRYEDGTPRDPQTMRLITVTGDDVKSVQSLDGVERRTDWMLLGEYNAQMTKHDMFLHMGGLYEIVELMPDLGYETRALVVRHG